MPRADNCTNATWKNTVTATVERIPKRFTLKADDSPPFPADGFSSSGSTLGRKRLAGHQRSCGTLDTAGGLA